MAGKKIAITSMADLERADALGLLSEEDWQEAVDGLFGYTSWPGFIWVDVDKQDKIDAYNGVELSVIAEVLPSAITATLTWRERLAAFHLAGQHDQKSHGDWADGGPGGDVGHGRRLATAKPYGVEEKKTYVAGHGARMGVDLISNPSGVVKRQREVPGFEDIRLDGPGGAEAAMEEIIRRQTENIFEQTDIVMQGNPKTAEAYSEWYPWAHDYMSELGRNNGVSEEGAIAAAAVLSASAAWESNVPWAKYLIENLGEGDGPGSDTGRYQTVKAEWVAGKYLSALSSWEKKKAELDKLGKEYKTPKPVPDAMASLVGKQLHELTDLQVADALRGKHEENATGKGAEGKLVRQLGDEVHEGLGTAGAGTIPQSSPNLAKAVSVLRDPSPENIDEKIGDQNKVRSFYQNMRDPLDREFEDVTVDTHHVGIANGIPFTMSSPYVGGGTESSKDIVSTPGNSKTGALGTYPLVVEATRRATKLINEKYNTNFTPNQVQSISWVGWKNYWPPRLRTRAVQESVGLARSAFARGEIDRATMLARIDAARAKASTKKIKAPTVAELLEMYRNGEL